MEGLERAAEDQAGGGTNDLEPGGPPIERPPEPIPEPLRDPDTPVPVKSPPEERPPEPVPEKPRGGKKGPSEGPFRILPGTSVN